MARTVTTVLVAALVVATAGAVPAATVAADTTNSPPTADVGDNRTVDEGATVRLDAGGSTDPDGDVVTHDWTQTAGPPVALSNRYAASPNLTAPTVESETTLTFEVTARDGNGGTDTDAVTVTVVPTNDPPTADVGAGSNRTVEAATSVELDAGNSTDPNGDDLSYTWRQVAGAGVALVDTGTATASFTAPSVDSRAHLVFEVTATDADGASDTETVDVTVTPAETTTYTRDELAQAVYGYDFGYLSGESAREIEELYLRQPFPDGTDPADLQTREALARERHGQSFDGLDRTATVGVQSAYDAQFVDRTGERDVAYTRDDISQAKYEHDFAAVSAETAGQVEELYDRQPFADASAGEVRTREELSVAAYGVAYADLSRESRLTIERRYDAQFGRVGSTANFSVTALSASDTGDDGGAVRVTARVTNHGAAATQSVELSLDRDGDGTLDGPVANKSLALNAGATSHVNFTVPADAISVERPSYGVATANDSRRATVAAETLAAVAEHDADTVGSDVGNVTDDVGRDGPVAAPERRADETVVDLSPLRANHRYEVDLGDSVATGGVTLTGQELMLVRSDDGGSLSAAASETAMGDAPALTGTFAYLRVEAEGLADEDIREVDFVFRVAPSRLDATGVDPTDVKLYRYHDGVWESYETVHRGDGRFESGNVPGYSVFAVAPADASVTTSTPADAETPAPTSTPTASESSTASPEPTDTPDAASATASGTMTVSPTEAASTDTDAEESAAASGATTASRTPGFTPVGVVAAIVVAALLTRRRRRR